MQSNLCYFDYCIDNPEGDFGKSFIFLEKDPRLKDYVENTKQIKEYLTILKVRMKDKASSSDMDKYFRSLQECLNRYSNRSEFICFAHACDTTLDRLRNDLDLLKKVSSLYIQKRDITELTPYEWVQALIDSQSSRRKGRSGEKKLITFCQNMGFAEAKD